MIRVSVSEGKVWMSDDFNEPLDSEYENYFMKRKHTKS